MRFVVDQAIWEHFPGLRIILVWADGIDNRTGSRELSRELEERMAALRHGWSQPNPQSHPYIAAWRDLVKKLGYSGKKFPSSIEALTRRVLSGKGLAEINPLVDFYNRISLTHLVPAGGWDLSEIGESPPLSTPASDVTPSEAVEAELRLGLTSGHERFRALGSDEEVGVEPGEAAYLVGDQVVTRHFVWRQSDLGKLTHETRRALLISECLEVVDDEVVRAVREDLESGITRHFGVEPRTAVLTAGAGPSQID